MEQYDLTISGASAAGVAAAAALRAAGQKVRIIERTVNCGSEFGAAFNVVRVQSPPASTLKTKMQAQGLLNNDGFTHLLPLNHILSEILSDSRVDVCMECEVLSIHKTDFGFLVNTFGKFGHESINTKNILDTTAEGAIAARPTLRYTKYLSAALTVSENSHTYTKAELNHTHTLPDRLGSFFVDKGLLKHEYYLRLPLEKTDDYRIAREKLFAAWEKEYTLFKPYEICAIAPLFCYRFDAPIIFEANGIRYAPSAAYANPFEAYTGGDSLWK